MVRRGGWRRITPGTIGPVYLPVAIVALGISFTVSNGVPPTMAWRIITIGALGGLVAMSLGRIVAGDWSRGAAVGAVLLLAPRGADWRLPALCVLAACLIVVDGRWPRQRRIVMPWLKVTEFVNVVSVLVLVLLLVGEATGGTNPAPVPDPVGLRSSMGAKPDVYIILADAYGRPDVLAERYGYRSDFPEQLEGRGLVVSPKSQTNYALTDLAMAAMFSGGHPFGDPVASTPVHVLSMARDAIADSRILPFLADEGYETWAMDLGYLPDAVLPVQHHLDPGTVNEFETVALTVTGFLSDLDWLAPRFMGDQLHDRSMAQLQFLRDLTRRTDAAPQFVFMHLPVPHFPFLLDEYCRARSLDDVDPTEVRLIGQLGDPRSVAYYDQQSRCAEQLMLDAVDVIETARPNAIILVMSDHGPDDHMNWYAPSDSAIADRMANFFAARTPGYPDPFGSDISVVNILPNLLNSTMGTHLPLRPATRWFGPILPDGLFTKVVD